MKHYRMAQRVVRPAWRLLVGPVHVSGTEHVPKTGPFFLISNHQSILDPVLLQAVCPRPVHTMAKSTQFTAPVVGTIIRSLGSFPVRRFETDPQAARTVLRLLGEGHGVGVYIEGERSWDGRLQEPRLGSVRLILKAGVPVVPAVIDGTYDVWPRWHRSLRRLPVRVTFGPPLRFPKLGRRSDREAALPAAAERIMAALGSESARARGRDAGRAGA
jgi:1-acyl-sn-glycerol-3-phosphate acyltransferase